MNEIDILLTGIPRSGSTLICRLLNQLPNVVALNEPMNVLEFPALKKTNKLNPHIHDFFQEMRRFILHEKKAFSQQKDGKILDNSYAAFNSVDRCREKQDSYGDIIIEKPLRKDFLLVIKHPAAFTAEIQNIMMDFQCFAVIRNPLSILASWNSIDIPVSTGHAPAAENLDPQLLEDLQRIPDTFGRQCYLLSWFFGKYRKFLPANNILRYENLIASGGEVLSVITPTARTLHESLECRNKNILYDKTVFRNLGNKLLLQEGNFWSFYSKDSVAELLED